MEKVDWFRGLWTKKWMDWNRQGGEGGQIRFPFVE